MHLSHGPTIGAIMSYLGAMDVTQCSYLFHSRRWGFKDLGRCTKPA